MDARRFGSRGVRGLGEGSGLLAFASGLPTLHVLDRDGVRRGSQRPWLGDTVELELAPVASAPSIAAVGILGGSDISWGSIALPLALGGLGASGCTLYGSVDAVVPLTAAGGVARWSIPIPNHAALLERSILAQGLLLGDPIRLVGLVTSNAGRGVLGSR